MRWTTCRPIAVSVLVSVFCGLCAAAQKPKRAEIVKTAINYTALHPGQKALAAIELHIKSGLHAQSHAPLDPSFVKFLVKMNSTPDVTFGEPIYPPGPVEDYPALGKLSVYTGHVVVGIPIEVKADAKPGPLELSGQLQYQICDDTKCFLPEHPSFTIKTQIVPRGTEVKPNEPELFRTLKEAPATAPAAGRGSEPPGGGAAPIEVAGHQSGAIAIQFLTAFLVGIIFNVVPCVLPVLPLKAVGFYKASVQSRIKSLSFGAVFSLGLIATFATFGVLIFGHTWVGFHDRFDWGQLFTKWWFTLLMVIILLAFAASQFGAFSVGVPRALYSISPRNDTYWGNFLFGILTALLSTPCTFGMFVGLLAWAITQPPSVGVLILVTVGAGMAFPYLVLSALPEVARRFPRTGPWAELVKQMMGFLLLLAAVYFARPFYSRVVHGEGFWWILFAVVVAAGLFLVIRTFEFSRTFVPRAIGVVLALLMVGGALGAVVRLTRQPYVWQTYSDSALQQARAAGKIALVEFTADWCGNCQYVEAKVLHSRQIVDAVRKHDVVMLKADVTRDDAPARPLLDRLNPAGSIPLTVIYSPNLRHPIELTGIYSRQDLEQALDLAAGSRPLMVTALSEAARRDFRD